MTRLKRRNWIPEQSEDYICDIAASIDGRNSDAIQSLIDGFVEENRHIHDRDCINLNPATNIMNPKAEAMLGAGLGARPSLGYPGDKYEMGLEAIEKIEVVTAELAARVFNADFAEIRVGSGALCNLYAFMATTRPGDNIIVPSADIGGHVTHQEAGAAGLYGVDIHIAPVDADNYTIDIEATRTLAHKVKPKLITIGGSLNLYPHPVSELREIADEVGAKLLFDAAHQCGIIAGGQWPNPLDQGAHLMTMSTYKSLGRPPSGLIVSNDAEIMERIDAIAFPGLTANFDVAKSASLAVTLLDWLDFGEAYAAMMVDTSKALAQALVSEGVDVFSCREGLTSSHQFALRAVAGGGGQTLAKKLRLSNLLTCGIGLPEAGPETKIENDLNGLRFGTPEITRLGMKPEHMPELAKLITRALTTNNPASCASDVTSFRNKFKGLHFIRQ